VPTGVECTGGVLNGSRAGSWAAQPLTLESTNWTRVWKCQRDGVCLGGVDSACLDGYGGPLCDSCVEGYYLQKETCNACPEGSSGGSLAVRAQLTLIAMCIAFCVGGAFALALFKSTNLDQAINFFYRVRTNPVMALSQLWTKRYIAKVNRRKKETHEASRALHTEGNGRKDANSCSCAAPGVNSNSPGRNSDVTVQRTGNPPAAVKVPKLGISPGPPPQIAARLASADALRLQRLQSKDLHMSAESSRNAKLQRARSHSARQTLPPAEDGSRQLAPSAARTVSLPTPASCSHRLSSLLMRDEYESDEYDDLRADPPDEARLATRRRRRRSVQIPRTSGSSQARQTAAAAAAAAGVEPGSDPGDVEVHPEGSLMHGATFARLVAERASSSGPGLSCPSGRVSVRRCSSSTLQQRQMQQRQQQQRQERSEGVVPGSVEPQIPSQGEIEWSKAAHCTSLEGLSSSAGELGIPPGLSPHVAAEWVQEVGATDASSVSISQLHDEAYESLREIERARAGMTAQGKRASQKFDKAEAKVEAALAAARARTEAEVQRAAAQRAALPPPSPPASPPAEIQSSGEEPPRVLEWELKGRGVVRVHLHGASNLKAAEITDKPLSPKGDHHHHKPFGHLFEHHDAWNEHHNKNDRDTFCELALEGGHTFKSETIRQTLNPEWNEHFSFRGEGGEGGEGDSDERRTLAAMLASPLTLTCYDEDRGFFGTDASHELGKATIDLSCLLTQREVALTVPLSWEGDTALAEGSISLTISWEIEEELEPEAEAEAPMTIEEQLAWECGLESLSALGINSVLGIQSAPAAAPAAASATLSHDTSMLSSKRLGPSKEGAKVTRKVSFSKKSAKKKGTQPDMLSLSISISILAKFMLFDLGFFQVNSALVVSMPDVEFPQVFKQMSSSLTGVFNLDFLTDWGEANCSLGGDQCFRVLLIMLTLVAFQLAFPAAVGLARFLPSLRKRVSQARLETLVDRAFHGNAIVMMVLHPVISKQLVGLVDCTYYNDENVLSSYKSVPCGSTMCSSTALVFVVIYTIGIPAYVYASLRAYLSPSAKIRYKGNPLLARYKARIGFICGKYEASFWYYELLEMTRKTGLMAVTSFLQTGSYSQLLAKLFIGCFFFAVLFRCSPFNSPRLDLLVTTSQFCTISTLFFALMTKIGFFVEEKVSVNNLASVLVFIMLFPLFVAFSIIVSAIYEGVDCSKCCDLPRSGFMRAWAKLRGMKRPSPPVRAQSNGATRELEEAACSPSQTGTAAPDAAPRMVTASPVTRL
jgi:hypothetical protein